jgi:GTPase
MQFIDEAKIFLQSGRGGNGCVSFRREANIPRGGPDGGNGGRGGHILFKVVSNLNTLIDFRYKQHFTSHNGEHGKGDQRNGIKADDVIINIPVGTQIYSEDGTELIMDLSVPDIELTYLRGGDGGFGNAHYKSSVNQAPRKALPGFDGQEAWIWLKLKLICDCGMVGLPNAGKSTFVASVSRARPKIADYPFTTLKPQLGVVYTDEKEFVIADIPGLIEGASEGKGLGHRFLKHVERSRVILHLVDCLDENFIENYFTIRKELANYSEILANKTEIIALNKCDALQKDEIEAKLKAFKKATKKDALAISAATGINKVEVLRKITKLLEVIES